MLLCIPPNIETIEPTVECIALKQELIKEIKRTMAKSPHLVVSLIFFICFYLIFNKE